MGTVGLASIGRFEVMRELGRGAQGVVWLARDPTLDRPVAIKTLHPQNVGADTHRLMKEALLVSRLAHPNIVQVYEIGEAAGQPFLVCEYVEGVPLRDRIKADGAMPVAHAVVMMSQILAGVAHAHGQGVLHLDLGGGNVLVDAAGRPHVTDFGISRLLGSDHSGEYRGTLRYMAPENFTNGPVGPTADVFALGLLFHEMLVGKPAVEGRDPFQVIYRITQETLPPPSTVNPRLDRRLDLIVFRALMKKPASRYRDAGEMKAALDQYRVPREALVLETQVQAPDCAVEFLLRRMQRKNDFPAMSRSMGAVNELASVDDDAAIPRLTNLILKEPALTTKLLKLANSAAYAGTRVSGVSQAITLLGIEQVRLAATSLMLASHLVRGPLLDDLRERAIAAFCRAIMARDLAARLRMANREPPFVCALFRTLGLDLIAFYFAEEYAEIKSLVGSQGMSYESASKAVMGLSYSTLGEAVARTWNFPDVIVDAMEPVPPGEAAPPATEAERIRQCATLAGELCRAVHEVPEPMRRETIDAAACRFEASFGLDPDDLLRLLKSGLEMGRKYAPLLGTPTDRCDFLANLAAVVEMLEGGDAAMAPPNSTASAAA